MRRTTSMQILSRRSIVVTRSIQEMQDYQNSFDPSWKKSSKGGIGFVPTMGALHAGHISLINEAKKQHTNVVVSIFVNPTQFGKEEDLDKYPRTFDKDLSMLKEAGVECVFAPQVQDMYGVEEPLCHVEPRAFSDILEGKARPDFFRGVATVVTKLFNIVQPTAAYFGQKDIAQCVLMQRMVRDLNIPVKIHVCETMREVDGLAMSSRNVYLKQSERKAAHVLYKGLSEALRLCERSTEGISREKVIEIIENVLLCEPLVEEIEYISVASTDSMRELGLVRAREEGAIISSAIRLGSVRLIDNVLVGRARYKILSTPAT